MSTTKRICHVHGDYFAACKGMPHPSRTLWCDGQGSRPWRPSSESGSMFVARKYGVCPSCGKTVTLRANGTLRAHNGKGR